jgi:hypothetical protein
VTARRIRLLAPLAAALVLAGCAGSTSPSSAGSTSATPGSPAVGTAEPSAAQAEAAAEAAADPGTATDPARAALAAALRATDLPAGWSVQANPVPDGDVSKNPSLAGICGYAFTSEAHRTAKFPVVAVDGARTAQVSSEAIAYDSAAAAGTAVQELVRAFSGCPADQYRFVPGPSADGLAAQSVVFQYEISGGVSQVVIAQARGAVLSVLIGEDPAATAQTARSIAGRLAALPAAAIGL